MTPLIFRLSLIPGFQRQIYYALFSVAASCAFWLSDGAMRVSVCGVEHYSSTFIKAS
jgi:hypothetical protein